MNYKTSIAWTFGSSKKIDSFSNYCETPGPGKYEDPKGRLLLNRSVSYSFGKKDRFDMKSKFSPGPGSYNTYNKFNNLNKTRSPSYTIKKATSNYDLFPKNDCLMFYETKKKWEGPSPNEYYYDATKLEKSKKKIPSYKFSRGSKEIKYHNHIPGPGSYQLGKNHISSTSPKWTINKSAKDDIWMQELKNSNSNTGPAKYEKPSYIGKGPKVRWIIY
jgi:hypothetical protein